MACDMIVAADDARFGEPEIRYGSGPVSLLMPFVLGQKKTNELLFTGDWVDAQEAERLGLVNRVAPARRARGRGRRARGQDRAHAAARAAPDQARAQPRLRGHGPAAGRQRQSRPLRDPQRRRDAGAARVRPHRRRSGPEGRAGVARRAATAGRDGGRGHADPGGPGRAARALPLRPRALRGAARARWSRPATISRSLHRISEAIEVPAEDVAHPLPAPGSPEREREAALGPRDHRARRDGGRRARGGHGDAVRLAGQGARARARRARADLPRPQARGSDALRRRDHADDELRDARRAGRGRRGQRRAAGAATRVAPAGCRRLALPRRRRRALAARARPRRPRATRSSSRARSSATAATACARSSCATSTTSARRSIPRSSACTAQLGGAITAELVSKRPGDAGGAARAARGRLARDRRGLPRAGGLPARAVPALQHEHALDRRRRARGARPTTPGAWPARSVDEREAIQLERLVGELTWWQPSRYVHVPRDGAESRFVPVKDADDLAAAQEQIAAICRERLALHV